MFTKTINVIETKAEGEGESNEKEVVVLESPKSPESEMFRNLRTNIQFMNADSEKKIMVITSTVPGEGKSYVTSNLAAAFSQINKKVLIIDADMRKGTSI